MTSSRSLIVGGTSGIGLATARALAVADGDVHVVGRNPERLEAIATQAPELHGHRADGSDGPAIGALAAALAPVDQLIVTLSGAEGIGPFAELDLAMLRRAFDAKFWAQLITAHTAMPGTAGIAAINAAVEAIVRPLAVELAPIRVNAVSPGFVDTPWWSAMPEADRRAYFTATAAALPTRQIATAEQIAEVVVLAAHNPNLTGTVLQTDGGLRLISLPT
jgi:NAD(P)-dependent dehydrogenase (short-subunit alcohol dehydrogenase family)